MVEGTCNQVQELTFDRNKDFSSIELEGEKKISPDTYTSICVLDDDHSICLMASIFPVRQEERSSSESEGDLK